MAPLALARRLTSLDGCENIPIFWSLDANWSIVDLIGAARQRFALSRAAFRANLAWLPTTFLERLSSVAMVAATCGSIRAMVAMEAGSKFEKPVVDLECRYPPVFD
jgi:hypothetical protein